jgi:hypothetical protein
MTATSEKPVCPWYKARVPTPVAWIVCGTPIVLALMWIIGWPLLCYWWATASIRAAGAEMCRRKGCYVISLPKGQKASLLLNADLLRLNSWFKNRLSDSEGLVVCLNDTDVTDDDLEVLRGLRYLDSVKLRNTNITDVGVRHMAQISALIQLDLENTKITDEGSASLEGLSHLRSLSLANTKITDAGVSHLRRLSDLYKLNLDGDKITDACIPFLAGLPQLSYVHVKGTEITEDGIKSLQKALPNCQIYK